MSEHCCMDTNSILIYIALTPVLSPPGSIIGITAAAEALPAELADAPLFLYLGSPLARSVRDLEKMSLKISDIPSHDSTRDLILLKDQRSVEFDVM